MRKLFFILSIFTLVGVYSCQETPTLDNVDIYPNPSKGLFTVDISGSNMVGVEVEITLRDMLGREVLVSRGTGGLFHLDARGVTAGTYLLVLTTHKGMYQSEIVITH